MKQTHRHWRVFDLITLQLRTGRTYPSPHSLRACMLSLKPRDFFTSALGSIPNTSQLCITGFRKVLCRDISAYRNPDRLLRKRPNVRILLRHSSWQQRGEKSLPEQLHKLRAQIAPIHYYIKFKLFCIINSFSFFLTLSSLIPSPAYSCPLNLYSCHSLWLRHSACCGPTFSTSGSHAARMYEMSPKIQGAKLSNDGNYHSTAVSKRATTVCRI